MSNLSLALMQVNSSITTILFELPSFSPENQKKYPLNSVCWSDKVGGGVLFVGGGVLVVALFSGRGEEGKTIEWWV